MNNDSPTLSPAEEVELVAAAISADNDAVLEAALRSTRRGARGLIVPPQVRLAASPVPPVWADTRPGN